MKATGMVRRIDDLGRVVIPKEIRRTLHIREGEPLEIFVNDEGHVIFKKYSVVGELSAQAAHFADVIYKTANIQVAISDRDEIVAVAGVSKKEYLGKKISPQISAVMDSRNVYIKNDLSGDRPLCENGDKVAWIIAPIISQGDVVGSVCAVTDDKGKFPGETAIKLITATASFLASHTEQ